MISTRETNPRERALNAIRHEEGDRIPRFVNFSSSVAERLRDELQLSDLSALNSYLQADVELCEIAYSCPHLDGKDLFGITYEKSPEKKRNKIKFHPLASIQGEDDIVYHDWPNPDWADYNSLKNRLSMASSAGLFTAATCGGSLISQTFNLIGQSNFMTAINYNPHLINAVIWKLNEFFMEVERRIFTCDHGIVDMSYHVNDLSEIDRSVFCDFFAGPLAELNRQAKSFGLKTMIYSPGPIPEAILPELMECGYDVIAPCQFSFRDGASRTLKNKYGEQIAVMGNVSVDSVLSLKSPDDIHEHVSAVCEEMKAGGGFIIGPDSVIGDNIPSENILAMYEAIDMYGTYD